MTRTGFANRPLHGGKAPRYLFERMVPLSREIIIFVAREFGREAQGTQRRPDRSQRKNPRFSPTGCVDGLR
jgi:hypothetical protein